MTVIRRRTILIVTKQSRLALRPSAWGLFFCRYLKAYALLFLTSFLTEDDRLRGSCLLLRSMFIQIFCDDVTQSVENILIQYKPRSGDRELASLPRHAQFSRPNLSLNGELLGL